MIQYLMNYITANVNKKIPGDIKQQRCNEL